MKVISSGKVCTSVELLAYLLLLLSTSGVPQGSNLGPLLFLIFVNDISSVIKNAQSLLFADDIKLFRLVNTVKDCEGLKRGVN